eukprot:11215307-Lingulodinium_polyedra.AAC.1
MITLRLVRYIWRKTVTRSVLTAQTASRKHGAQPCQPTPRTHIEHHASVRPDGRPLRAQNRDATPPDISAWPIAALPPPLR